MKFTRRWTGWCPGSGKSRRDWPALQRLLHRGAIVPILQGRRVGPPKPLVAVLRALPRASFAPAYLIGAGLRPEHAPLFARREATGTQPARP